MKIALISGSRSDRNALEMVFHALNEGPDHEPSLLEFRHQTIVDSVADIQSNWGAWDKFDYELAVLHGDRIEILSAAIALNHAGVPIAHIGGGDITEGSQDDCFRHAITKLSHLHFASNQDSADRIIQMGEEPGRVHVTGCPGIDMVMATPTLGQDETDIAVGLNGAATPQRTLLVLFHPNTLGDTASELEALSVALARRTEALVLLGPNADAGGDLIRREWQRLAQNRPDTVYHDNVEPQVFYSLLKWCDVLVGNSSAGFYEAPCFDIQVINIGDRQKGRPHPFNVRTCPDMMATWIGDFIDRAIKTGFGKGNSQYGDGHAAERIAKVIGGIEDPRVLLRKKFRTCPKMSGGYCSLDENLEPLPYDEPSRDFVGIVEMMDRARERLTGREK